MRLINGGLQETQIPENIVGIEVFLEKRKTRTFVGSLRKIDDQFHFCYDEAYLKMKNILSLGVEFPLTKREFFSSRLFPTFQDRLPEPENPAYVDYCAAAKIPVTTKDPIVLLGTIGKKGPSSFIYEPIYKNEFSFEKVEEFLRDCELSMQDFAHLFDISVSILQKIKAGSSLGGEVLSKLEICFATPEALYYQVQKNRRYLHFKKLKKLDEYLKEARIQKFTELIKEFTLNSDYRKSLVRAVKESILIRGEICAAESALKKLRSSPWEQNLTKRVDHEELTHLTFF